jgi:hypothetical protein
MNKLYALCLYPSLPNHSAILLGDGIRENIAIHLHYQLQSKSCFGHLYLDPINVVTYAIRQRISRSLLPSYDKEYHFAVFAVDPFR